MQRSGVEGRRRFTSRCGGRMETVCRCLVVLALLLLAGCAAPADAWERVQQSGVLRVGMDASFLPFEFVDEEGSLVGFDVDLAREIAARLGVEAVFVANLPYDGLYDALTAGQVDVVISALYLDPEREGAFAYSTPYFNAGQVLVVAEGTEGIVAVDDLAGRTVAVEFGSAGDVEARQLSGVTVLPCETAADALAQVAAGRADVALVDHLSALTGGAGAGGGLRIVGPPVTDEPYAAAVRRESRGLLRAINEALAQMAADGTLDCLEREWFSP